MHVTAVTVMHVCAMWPFVWYSVGMFCRIHLMSIKC